MLKIYGYFAPALKGEIINDAIFKSKEITSSSLLYVHLVEILHKAELECDIPVSFVPEKGKQVNDMRTMIIALLKSEKIKDGLPIVKRLCTFTDKKTKDGLLFLIIEKEDAKCKLCMARFPSEIGIMVNNRADGIDFEIKNDVFLKNSKRYKSIVFSGDNFEKGFWEGNAVDRQISGSERMKDISDYWIKDFMICDLKITPKRGSKMLAKALQKTVSNSEDEEVKREIINASALIKTQKGKTLSVVHFFDMFKLSDAAKNAVIDQFEESEKDITKAKFVLDVEEFFKYFNYRFVFMDNGAIAVASSEKFGEVWAIEAAENEGEYKYSTSGSVVKEKIASRL